MTTKKPASHRTNPRKPILPQRPPEPTQEVPSSQGLRLDLGCGSRKREGFLGVDRIRMPGVDFVCDLTQTPWVLTGNTLPDGSVDAIVCSHFLEHLTNLNGAWERTRFFNEVHRVLRVGGTIEIIVPHWCSNRFYGDPTHKEPWSEMSFYYLNREWRLAQAPHSDANASGDPNLYDCDLQGPFGYGVHPEIQARNVEYQQHALAFWKEAAQDLVATLTKMAPAGAK